MGVRLRGSESRCSHTSGALLDQPLAPPLTHPFSLLHSQSDVPTRLFKSGVWQGMEAWQPDVLSGPRWPQFGRHRLSQTVVLPCLGSSAFPPPGLC